MRGKNLVNLLRALELLCRPQGATITEMGRQVGIDRRSVYRLLDIISELGFPLTSEKVTWDRKKRWRMLDPFQQKLPNMSMPDVRLTIPEIIALYLLKGGEGIYKGTEIEKEIASAFTKIGMFVPGMKLDGLKKIRSLLIPASGHAKDYTGFEETIDTLTQAILRERSCHVTYHTFYNDTVSSFPIDPLHFFEHHGGLYLFVRKKESGEIKTLAVERIQSIMMTGKSFEYPEDFNFEEMLASAFGIVHDEEIEVKIRFSATQAKYIRERRWSMEQEITDLPDGEIILVMKTSGWWELKAWVLSYGADAFLLAPEDLRQEIIVDIHKMRKNYFAGDDFAEAPSRISSKGA